MRILITGVTGTLGRAVLDLCLNDGHRVVGISRDEQKQRDIQEHGNLVLRLADVRDPNSILKAISAQGDAPFDVCFHFAALKCIDTLNTNILESVYTNVTGTENIKRLQESGHIGRIIFSSTDKAVLPVNVYGYCKAIAEKIILQDPRNVVCRYGNVLGSRGSVIPLFVKSLKDKKSVHVTSKDMTRYWITIEAAAAFVYSQIQTTGGFVAVPQMKAAGIVDIAMAIANVMGMQSLEIYKMEIRPGEKWAESLINNYRYEKVVSVMATRNLESSALCQRYTQKELVDLISPIVAGLA